MLKRLRWLVTGFVLGVVASAWLQLRLRGAARRYTPPEVAGRVGQRLAVVGRDVRAALDVGRDAMQVREDELRDVYAVPDPTPRAS